MPRKPCFPLPGVPQHIIQRGNNRELWFPALMDFRHYLEDLGDALQHNKCKLHTHMLMTNHVLILVT